MVVETRCIASRYAGCSRGKHWRSILSYGDDGFQKVSYFKFKAGVIHLYEFIQFVDVAVTVAVEINVGRDVKGERDRSSFGQKQAVSTSRTSSLKSL